MSIATILYKGIFVASPDRIAALTAIKPKQEAQCTQLKYMSHHLSRYDAGMPMVDPIFS